MKEFTITKENENQRADKFLLKLFSNMNKSLLYKLIRKKRIKLNKGRLEGSEILKEHDVLTFYLAEDTMKGLMSKKEITPVNITFETVYEDGNLIIVNKPKGVMCQKDEKNKISLIDEVIYYLYDKGEYNGEPHEQPPALLNRLDTNTSGLVMIGKNLKTIQHINAKTKENKIEKHYYTIVKGDLKENATFIDKIVKDSSNVAHIADEGKEIITMCKPIERINGYTIIDITIFSGKSHQIRSHLAEKGLYVLGDRKYGDIDTNTMLYDALKIRNQLLCSYKLIFHEMDGELSYLNNLNIEIEMPKEFYKVKRLLNCS